ncbi:hypothetical protein LLG39_14820 [bacterium]|nr:hypothetical protein [bacterium]
MARKTLFTGDEDLDKLAAQIAPRSSDYVGPWLDESPFEGLLWLEVRKIERSAHMTKWQATIFEWYIRGFSNLTIAQVFSRDESTIRQHLDAALVKAESCPYRGVITLMIENLGWNAVREYLTDQEDARALKNNQKKVCQDAQKRGQNRPKVPEC